jgi:hypothetical protein
MSVEYPKSRRLNTFCKLQRGVGKIATRRNADLVLKYESLAMIEAVFRHEIPYVTHELYWSFVACNLHADMGLDN